MNLKIVIGILLFCLFPAAMAFSQNEVSPVEAKYSVGSTTCEIKNYAKVYKVTWADGTINILNLSSEGNKDQTIWIEHKDGDNTEIARFIFNDWNFKAGTYRDAGGKESAILRKE